MSGLAKGNEDKYSNNAFTLSSHLKLNIESYDINVCFELLFSVLEHIGADAFKVVLSEYWLTTLKERKYSTVPGNGTCNNDRISPGWSKF